MSAQLKTLIDRFCAFNTSIQRKGMESALLTVAWDQGHWTFNGEIAKKKSSGKRRKSG